MLNWGINLNISVKCNTQLNLHVVKTSKGLSFKEVLNITSDPGSVLNHTRASP